MAGFFDTQIWVIALLLSAMVFVNGWTDAPNAVATCVASGAMPLRRAVNMSAACNFLGLMLVSVFGSAVGEEIISSIPSGENTLVVLCSAMIAVVLFASLAAVFGIPTSESHALVAAVSGASVAASGARGFSGRLWVLVAAGIVITSVLGAVLGLVFKRILQRSSLARRKRTLSFLQIFAAALLSIIHGAQDGQKFSAVMVLGLSFAGVGIESGAAELFCAVVLALGTALGGKRIIKKVGSGITAVDDVGGVCCDAAAFAAILLCTCFGMPVSTTHTKTSAVLGVGIANKSLNTKTYYEIFSLWILTFPVCFGIGYVLTLICI